jgi:hypothetical protein
MKFKKNILLWNYWANLNQTLKFLFVVMAAILDTGRADGLIFERGPPKDHFSKVYFKPESAQIWTV